VRIAAQAWIETTAVLEEGLREVRFVGLTAEAAMHAVGRLPLPPYIERDPTAADEARYQTVFAEREGSVAAPTAGLHFTPALLSALESRGVELARLDLEVGPGTFKPVEVEDPTAHPMHPERFDIPAGTAAAIARLRARGGKLWAVGTTVVRALESAAREDGTVAAGAAETRLLIAPGFRFRVTDRLLTNFHLPRSTLLMLVAAFGGRDRILAGYRHAVAARYRFYSYGDAMVIL
jgi:S-adenosylmethionine:tRNA ribosyltransferase-isomerase